MGDAVAWKMMSAPRVDLPGSRGPVGGGGGGAPAHNPPPPPPPRCPLRPSILVWRCPNHIDTYTVLAWYQHNLVLTAL